MIRGLKNIIGYTLTAVDGEVGDVRDFYYDNFNWVVRYMAVEVETGRSLLLSPAAAWKMDVETHSISVNKERDFILNSPSFDLDKPITRVFETELHNYYEWPAYWSGSLASYPLVELLDEMREHDSPEVKGDQDQEHIRSIRNIFGKQIKARDGEIGHVYDLLVEDEAWNMLYMVVDTGAWLPGRKVLVSPSWVTDVDWQNGQVKVDLKRETIENSPEYDPSVPLDETYDAQLREYYKRGRE